LSSPPKITNLTIQKIICSAMNHNVKKPRAEALRFTKIPKNKQNEKKAKSLIKKANKYSKSVNTIANSVYDEKE